MAKKHSVLQTQLHFRVRPLLLRFLVNAVSLAVTVIIVPHVFFAGDYRILSWLLISAVFGLLNAFLKPLLQILMLPLIFVSYGLVVVLINTVLLWTLAWIFTERFQVQHILWAFVGGLVCGLFEGLLQNLFGLTPPIVEGGPEGLKKEIAKHKHGLLEKELLAVTAEDVPALAEGPADADRPGGATP
ncbi:MAG: phage holin family protein [Actinobacteria bacterium]|nr:phage holin family protein [Actinomycetota bacterium]